MIAAIAFAGLLIGRNRLVDQTRRRQPGRARPAIANLSRVQPKDRTGAGEGIGKRS
jgi:hypothetical protein